MELQHYFLGLIGAIGAIHLLASAGQWIGQLTSKRRSHGTAHAATSGERDDWYVFFHCADLLGANRVSSQSVSDRSNQIRSAGTHQQKSARRPRIQARM